MSKEWVKIAVMLEDKDDGFFWKYQTRRLSSLAAFSILHTDGKDGINHGVGILDKAGNGSSMWFRTEKQTKQVYEAFLDAIQGKETLIENLISIELI